MLQQPLTQQPGLHPDHLVREAESLSRLFSHLYIK
jgi:hypothetical protein